MFKNKKAFKYWGEKKAIPVNKWGKQAIMTKETKCRFRKW